MDNNTIMTNVTYEFGDNLTGNLEAEEVTVYTDKPWWLDNFEMHDKFGFHKAVS